MTADNETIVFKSKTMKLSSSGRSTKGKACPSGQSKKALVTRINEILKAAGKEEKYTIEKSTITERYGEEYNDVQSSKKSKWPIDSVDLCCETEILLRYLDSINHNNKRWFLNSIESQINTIEKKGR